MKIDDHISPETWKLLLAGNITSSKVTLRDTHMRQSTVCNLP